MRELVEYRLAPLLQRLTGHAARAHTRQKP
jgi:hypothetical protein